MISMNSITRAYYRVFPMKFIRYHAYRVQEMVKRCAALYDNSGMTLLDIGAGDTPYKALFNKIEYFSQDFIQNQRNTIDFVYDISKSNDTVPSKFADVVICTQVLEHVSDPGKALSEIFRILKPQGVCYLSTHMSFEEHMLPHDYWRFTENGIKKLATQAGFEVLDFQKHGGSAQMLHLLFWTWPMRIFFSKRNGFGYFAYSMISTPFVLISGILALFLDKFDRSPLIYPNFEIILCKK